MIYASLGKRVTRWVVPTVLPLVVGLVAPDSCWGQSEASDVIAPWRDGGDSGGDELIEGLALAGLGALGALVTIYLFTATLHGDGRVYRIAVTATDPAGGRCQGVVKVGVPRERHGRAVDSDGNYDSFKGAH